MFHGNIDQFGKSLPGIQLCLRSDLRKQTRKRKDKKSIQRCQIDRLAKGYKRAIDKIRGPIAKNGFLGQKPARWPENGPPSGRTATYLGPWVNFFPNIGKWGIQSGATICPDHTALFRSI